MTAYDHFALKAFQYEAINYLLKPVSITDLQKVVERMMKSNQPAQEIHHLLSTLKGHISNDDKLIISDRKGWQVVKTTDLMYLEADGSYCKMYLLDGKCITTSRNMKYMESQLNNNVHFLKVHKSFIVNKHYIKSYLGEKNRLLLTNEVSVPVSITSKEIMNAIK